MNALLIVLAALATWRAARAVALEDGPFDLFTRLQDRAGQTHWVGRGLRCVLCVAVWLALPAALLVGVPDWRALLLLWGGIAGGAALIHKVVG